jgi:hypothetical protein
LLLLTGSLIPLYPVSANHEPIYKSGIDTLYPDNWEAHFVWLRSPYFNFLGEVWWRLVVLDEFGTVDVLFLDWEGFQAFRDGEPFEALVDPLQGVRTGSGWKSGLDGDLPYFLVLLNPGRSRVQVIWAIFAELDYRRWQGQEPGPTLDLDPVISSPPLQSQESWETTFEEPGFYISHTRPFLDNTGFIEVVPSPAPGPPVDIGIRYLGFHPEVIRVAVGTTVRWTNLDTHESTVEVGILPEGVIFYVPPSQPAFRWVLLPAAVAVGGALALLRLFRRKPPRN